LIPRGGGGLIEGPAAHAAGTLEGEEAMIIGVVRIPRDGKSPRDEAVERALASSKIYREVKGLLSKHYLNGDEGGGGIYMFDTRENALAWFDEGWADWMEGRFGVRPTLTLYDCDVVLDNVKGEVRVDGEPAEIPV